MGLRSVNRSCLSSSSYSAFVRQAFEPDALAVCGCLVRLESLTYEACLAAEQLLHTGEIGRQTLSCAHSPLSCGILNSFNNGRSDSQRSTFNTKMSQMRSRNRGLCAEPEMCGVRITLGNCHNGWSDGSG